MKNITIQYQAIMEFRDGTRMKLSTHKTKEQAMVAIQENMKYNNRKVVDVGGGLGMSFSHDPTEENSFDLIKYEVRSREVAPWEVLEEIVVD